MAVQEIVCFSCSSPKAPGEFYNRSDNGKKMGVCKSCIIDRTLAHRRDNPVMHKKYAATQRAQYRSGV